MGRAASSGHDWFLGAAISRKLLLVCMARSALPYPQRSLVGHDEGFGQEASCAPMELGSIHEWSVLRVSRLRLLWIRYSADLAASSRAGRMDEDFNRAVADPNALSLRVGRGSQLQFSVPSNAHASAFQFNGTSRLGGLPLRCRAPLTIRTYDRDHIYRWLTNEYVGSFVSKGRNSALVHATSEVDLDYNIIFYLVRFT